MSRTSAVHLLVQKERNKGRRLPAHLPPTDLPPIDFPPTDLPPTLLAPSDLPPRDLTDAAAAAFCTEADLLAVRTAASKPTEKEYVLKVEHLLLAVRTAASKPKEEEGV
eukprot:1152931-Pelagomonas_calceolata.AAC.5